MRVPQRAARLLGPLDADAALPHAHALGLTAVATVTRIDIRAGVKRAEETGEVLPGVEVEAGPAK